MTVLERIEGQAAQLLSTFADTRSVFGTPAYPVHAPQLVMRCLGLHLEPQVDPRDPRGRRLSGGLLMGEGTPKIIYRIRPGQLERERLVIAHEIGHYILHREEEPDYYCTEEDMTQTMTDPRPHRRREWEANLFAGALIMPRDELRVNYHTFKGDPEQLMAYFGVSREALYWRLVLVGLAPAWGAVATEPLSFRGVRVLHFADAHIGAENIGRWPLHVRTERRRDFLRALEATVRAAIDHQVDVLLFTGDAFQDRLPSNEDQKAFAGLLWPAIAKGIHVVLLVGNHDRPASGEAAHSLWAYNEFAQWLSLSNVHVAVNPGLLKLQTANGPVDIAALPFVPPSLIAAGSPSRNPHGAVVDWAEGELLRLANERRQGAPAILAGHFTVVGAATGGERHLMSSAARDLCLPAELVTRSDWDYIGLGHIHKAQAAGAIVYAGSLERVDFGEEVEAKGYVLVDVTKGNTQWRFIPLEGTRPFKTITVAVKDEPNPTEMIVAALERYELQGALVRLRIELYRSQQKKIHIQRVNEALQAMGALAWQRLQFDFADSPPSGESAVVTAARDIDGSLPLEALRTYLGLRADLKGDVEALMELAREIEEHPELHGKLAKRVRKEA